MPRVSYKVHQSPRSLSPNPSSLLPALLPTLAPAAHHRTFARAGPAAWVPIPLLLALLTSAESRALRDRFPELVGGDFTLTWEVAWHSLSPRRAVCPARQGLYGQPVPQQIHGVKEPLDQVSSSWVVRKGAARGCGKATAESSPSWARSSPRPQHSGAPSHTLGHKNSGC